MKEVWNCFETAPHAWIWLPVCLVVIYFLFMKGWGKIYKADKEKRSRIQESLLTIRKSYRSLYWEQANSLPLVEKSSRFVLVSIGGGDREEVEGFVKGQRHIEGYIMNQTLPRETLIQFREQAKQIIQEQKGNMWHTILWQVFRIYVFLQLIYIPSLIPQPHLPAWIPFLTALFLCLTWWKKGATVQILVLGGLFYFLYAHLSLSANLFLIVLLGSGALKKYRAQQKKTKQPQ